MQIVELLIRGPDRQTGGGKTGTCPRQTVLPLQYLEKLGLIEVAETRMVANMVEKVYHASADMLDVDPSLFRFAKEGENEPLNMAVTSIIDATRDDLIRSFQARQFQLEQGAKEQPRLAIINRLISRLPEERVAEFQERLVP
jgi:hypothetical protein